MKNSATITGNKLLLAAVACPRIRRCCRAIVSYGEIGKMERLVHGVRHCIGSLWSGWQFWQKRKAVQATGNIVLQSRLTCPDCGFQKTETMPTDACQFFYQCEGCGALLRPRPGDCCVFCSYGTVKCPPVQSGSHCC